MPRPASSTADGSIALSVVSTHVLVRGTGLIGTSLGIALSRKGYAVHLADPSPTAERLARQAEEFVNGGASI